MASRKPPIKPKPVPTLTEIKKAVSRAVREICPEFEIYEEGTEQGMHMPAIVIAFTGSNARLRIGREARFVYLRFSIRVYCKTVREIGDTVFRLQQYLNYIELEDGPVKVLQISNPGTSEIMGTVTFRLMLSVRPEDEGKPLMESLDFKENLTNEH